MRRTCFTRIALALSLFSAAAGLAACTSGAHGTPAASASATMSEAEILAIAGQYSQCMRDHGITSFGDPQIREHGLSWPVPEGVPQAQVDAADESCHQLLDPIPRNLTNAEPISDADLQKLVQFAQCLRANGLPEWPDPKSDGTFPIHGTPMEGKSDTSLAAMDKCKQYWDKEIGIS